MVEEQAAQQQKEEIIIMIVSEEEAVDGGGGVDSGGFPRSFVLMSLQSRALDVSPVVGSVQFDSILSRRAHCKCMAIV